MTKEEGIIAINELYNVIEDLEKSDWLINKEKIKDLKFEILRIFNDFSKNLELYDKVKLRIELGIISLELENKNKPKSLNDFFNEEKIEKENLNILS